MSKPGLASVFVAGLGATTPVGRSSWSSASAIRAGITGFVHHPYLVDTAGEPMRVALAPWLTIDVQGVDRFGALLLPAMEEALSGLGGSVPPERLALALGLPSPRPGLPKDLAAQLTRLVQQRYAGVFGSVAVFEAGHAAGLFGMHAAFRHLGQGTLDACVVAAADSWLEAETMEWLEAQDQIHGAGPLNNAWGFIPGEAGAALLLVREGAGVERRGTIPARVLGIGRANEPKHIKSQAVCTGQGLTAAFDSTLQALPPGAKVSDVYCDMNGEPYRADEFGFSVLRTKEHFESASDFTAPADCWGDVGAAGSLLHAMLAYAAAAKDYARGPLTFVCSSSEMGERAATLLDFSAFIRRQES